MPFFMTQIKLQTQQIIDALNEVYNVEEILKLHFRSYYDDDRSDQDLLDLCKIYLGKDIRTHVHNTPWDKGAIIAFVVTYPEYFDICLLGELNYCHAKFALCKELFHTIIQNPEFQSIDSDSTIDACAAGGSLNGIAGSEFVAEIAAMEYLFPFKQRKLIFEQGNIDFDAVAEKFKVPRLLVEKFLTPFRMETLTHCYNKSSYVLKSIAA